MAAIPSCPERDPGYPYFADEPHERGLVRKVALAWEYPVYFTHDAFSWENLTLVRALTRRAPRARHALVLVAGSEVAKSHATLVEDFTRYVDVHRERLALADVAIVDPKNEGAAEQIRSAVDSAGGSAAIVALGGRSLQESAGLVAASARTPLVRLPTSVLAQAELAGAADLGTPPLAVICDFDWLGTLPRRAARAGIAAAVECALLWDPSFFGWLHLHATSLAKAEKQAICELVRRCAVPHVERSASDHGALDFARWAAPILVGTELGHGEALSLAIALDAARSAVHGLLDVDDLDTILSTMDLLALPTAHPLLERDEVRAALVDRMRAMQTSALLTSTGRVTIVDMVDPHALDQAIAWLAHRASGLRRA
ncbi:MAG: 3-dehydroquinate synthase family protein [Polyangiales bacterium]